jgi:hypothetical protein
MAYHRALAAAYSNAEVDPNWAAQRRSNLTATGQCPCGAIGHTSWPDTAGESDRSAVGAIASEI